MTQEVVRIQAPARLSWIDSFATADSCPLSPRYRGLALKKANSNSDHQILQKSFSQPCLTTNDKENSKIPPLLRISSSPFNTNRNIFSPRYQAVSVDRKTTLRNAEALNCVLSPRYTNTHAPFSPRYKTLCNEGKIDYESDSDFSEHFDEENKVFSPRYAPLSTPSAESDPEEIETVSKLSTVLAMLEQLDNSCSEFDDSGL